MTTAAPLAVPTLAQVTEQADNDDDRTQNRELIRSNGLTGIISSRMFAR